MTPTKDSPRAPSDRSSASDEKAPNRRGSGGFDARDVLAGRLDDVRLSQAAGERR
jgi:hypothetical protein